MLSQHIQRAFGNRWRILRADVIWHRVPRALHHLENDWQAQRIAFDGSIHAVVCAADTLCQAACALRRADMHDEIDIAPVDPESSVDGGDNSAKLLSAMACSTLRLARHPASRDAAQSADCRR